MTRIIYTLRPPLVSFYPFHDGVNELNLHFNTLYSHTPTIQGCLYLSLRIYLKGNSTVKKQIGLKQSHC